MELQARQALECSEQILGAISVPEGQQNRGSKHQAHEASGKQGFLWELVYRPQKVKRG